MTLSDHELYDREIEERWNENDRYDIIRRNLTERIEQAVDELNPYYRTHYDEKLIALADLLEEIAEDARELAVKF